MRGVLASERVLRVEPVEDNVDRVLCGNSIQAGYAASR